MGGPFKGFLEGIEELLVSGESTCILCFTVLTFLALIFSRGLGISCFRRCISLSFSRRSFSQYLCVARLYCILNYAILVPVQLAFEVRLPLQSE